MEVAKIIDLIEKFAPLDTQESWDCSGWVVDLDINNIKKILLCVSVTEGIINQAIEKNCDLIISHHPLFFVPMSFNKVVSIYSAHTNLDKTDGGTTDTLIDLLGFKNPEKIGYFLRMVDLTKELFLDEFIKLLKSSLNLKNLSVVNNHNQQKINKVAFCAGSGASFANEAKKYFADILVTGDVKYHNAVESNIILIDIGHFESEAPVLSKIKELFNDFSIEVIIADEKTPFITY